MKSLPLLFMLGLLVFVMGAAPANGMVLDTNNGQAFQIDPTLEIPTLPIEPTATPADAGASGNTILLIIGVILLGVILLVLLIWAISRSSRPNP